MPVLQQSPKSVFLGRMINLPQFFYTRWVKKPGISMFWKKISKFLVYSDFVHKNVTTTNSKNMNCFADFFSTFQNFLKSFLINIWTKQKILNFCLKHWWSRFFTHPVLNVQYISLKNQSFSSKLEIFINRLKNRYLNFFN